MSTKRRKNPARAATFQVAVSGRELSALERVAASRRTSPATAVSAMVAGALNARASRGRAVPRYDRRVTGRIPVEGFTVAFEAFGVAARVAPKEAALVTLAKRLTVSAKDISVLARMIMGVQLDDGDDKQLLELASMLRETVKVVTLKSRPFRDFKVAALELAETLELLVWKQPSFAKVDVDADEADGALEDLDAWERA